MRTYRLALLMLAVSAAVAMVAERMRAEPVVPEAGGKAPPAAENQAKQPFTESGATASTATASPGGSLIAHYRRLGPHGLAQLLEEFDSLHVELAAASEDPFDPAFDDLQQRIVQLEQLIDAVGGQRYCTASRLFWYTDWDDALKAAQASGRPILSLRMLGLLTEELSCANSRFFRTTLYANREISAYLREHFILHWRSVRPVPKVTIDFGNGRKLVRTVTGNSAHYVVASTGEVVDALPGLYGPAAFLEKLQTAEAAAVALAKVPSAHRPAQIQQYHRQRLAALDAAWKAELVQLGRTSEGQPVPGRAENTTPGPAQELNPPPARAATAVAVPKAFIEMPLVAAITPPVPLPEEVDDSLWDKIAWRHITETELDQASEMLIRRQTPMAARASGLAETKARQESPLLRMLAKLRTSIALDTVRNEYLLHRQIHQWFINSEAPDDLETLNERVYAELFLTPSSDPWLGLVVPDTYTAIENDGITFE